MTVSTTTNKVSYIGNGIATNFAIPFPFLEKEHLKIYQLLNDIQTQREDWTVQNDNLIFETPPALNAQIVIMREVPLTQETNYQENEILPAETLERDFDKLMMLIQQLKEKTDRAVTVDVFDETDAANLIPSIKQSVSEAATYASTAQSEAQTAANQAQNAAISATNAENSESNTATMLATKTNIDVDNLSTNGKKNIAAYVFPNTTAVIQGIFNSQITTTAQTFTADQNGYLCLAGDLDAYSYLIGFLNNVLLFRSGNVTETGTNGFSVFIPIKKDDTFTIKAYQNTASLDCNVFIPSNF